MKRLSMSSNSIELLKLNSLIAKLNSSNQFSRALQVFDEIHSSHHLKPDHYTLATALTACANLHDVSTGAQLHSLVVRCGFKAYPHVCNSLLSLYSKSNQLTSVIRVFSEISSPDVYSWTTLLSAHVKCGRTDVAIQVFDRLPHKNIAMWNAVLTGCVENGSNEIAFNMFWRMHLSGVGHDHYSLASVLSLCCRPVMLDFGRLVHGLVVRTGFLSRVSVVNAILTMYFNCEMVPDSYELFEEAKANTCNQITYNAMIAGLVSCGKDLEALIVFIEMQEAYFTPTELTFVSVMSSCSSVKMLKFGQQVHSLAVKVGFEAYTSVSNATMTMYSNCEDLGSACLVFEMLQVKDLVSWNSIVAVYAQWNYSRSAVDVYLQMQIHGIAPDEFTVGSLLSCSELETTKMIQALVTKTGLTSHAHVCNALLSSYSKYGVIVHARQVFVDMSCVNLISWNSLISACLFNGLTIEGLQLFSKMLISGFAPNEYTLSTVLSICAAIPALGSGKEVHGYILRIGFDSEVSLCNALITTYAKCGNLKYSSKVFDGMTRRDVVTWNSMIAAYSQHGEGKRAISCFKKMQELGVLKPDEATFTTVLSACSHAGLVDQGLEIFSSMVEDYGMEPRMDQYCCIIDLLGRAGRLTEAYRLINTMPFQADSSIWWVVLSACAAHGNVMLGTVAAKFLLDEEPNNSVIYVLLSNIYAAVGQWEDSASMRELMTKHGVMKQPGFSWIEPQKPSECR
ncbi:hypothetical protein Scep_016010 [Stephania cephalantha]|uniref:Pentatricopeptide repeat-containing protein n=1 Tax=Stephania cephalantha TaxID=152367 RepID=A0AAP0INQ8_9MAGN